MPLRGHRPIHERFSEHHRPVATGTQTGRCTITRQASTGGTVNPGGTYTPAPSVQVYRGSCRIVPAAAGQRQVTVGDDVVVLRRYSIAIEWDAPEIRVDDLLTVDAAADPEFAGKALRIIDVQYSGEQWERVLVGIEDVTAAGG